MRIAIRTLKIIDVLCSHKYFMSIKMIAIRGKLSMLNKIICR